MDNIKTTPLNGKSKASTPVRGFVDQAAEVTGDIIELAELQLKLVKADATDAAKRSVFPIAICVFSGLLTTASLPIVLLGLSELIANRVGLSPAISHIAFGTLVMTIASLLAAIACVKLKRTMLVFQRSSSEFNSNIAWLKTVFRTTKSIN